MNLVLKIKSSPRLKNFVYWALCPINQARPRLWVKLFINPFVHKKGKGSLIRRNTRMDVMPWNAFCLGENSTIEDFSTVNNLVGDVIIGDRTRIGMSNVLIGPICIGNDVIFAQNIVLSGLNHGYEDIEKPPAKQLTIQSEIVVENDVWIGANCVIVSGVNIGKHSIVAAGSIVTKSVPPFTVVAGNPAKIIKQYNFEIHKWEKINK